ncbi:sulfatase family protein [Halomonas heilongjiangensis]|uniref:Sulfatase n=1 Tax=Halomonas heilongjiangensis TaxID=1387883 RepID=A0A2N7TNH1_9GAMM|nr:sulfatase-like hydrolase/transferase [Halomonas heilongjiangensis]PMR69715.1 sulfatase [Halomonas heilongjiangensis]PXX93075.1 sulfatase [Halomonas heilongjiangensis]
MRRPNFVLFITDQQRADHLGCYGNPTVKTPHLDGLAERGVRFERFHVATPICQPNRAALVTGQMPSVNGVRQNGIPLGLDSLTFAEVLRESGYRSGYIGKAHFQNVTDIPAPPRAFGGEGEVPPADASLSRRSQRDGPDYGWEVRRRWAEQPGLELPGTYYGFEHARLCIGHGDLVDGHYTAWLRERHPDPESLRGPANALPQAGITAPQCWRTAVPEALYPTGYVKQQACDFLADQDADTPFVLVVSFPDPHHPFTPPGRYWSLYDPDDVELPASFHHPVEAIAGIPPEALEAYRWGAEDPGSHWPFAVGERHAREIIALNYGSIAMVDDAVGEVLACLKAQGLADDTVVAFTSDHGDYMGDHGSVLKMGLHFQSVLRVPLIWYDPRRPGEGEVSGRLGSAIDLAPTLLQRAGFKVPVGMQGQDLFDDAPAADVLVEDPGIRVFRDSDARCSVISLVTERWRLSLFEGLAWGELYDLADDPHELDNRWDDPASREVRLELQHRLNQRLVALRDKSLVATARA